MKLTRLLLEELPKFLPIKTKINPNIINNLDIDLNIGKDVEFDLKNILYIGKEGGVIGELSIEKNPLLISITHLVFNSSAPMYDIITNYQKERISNLSDNRF